jgi:hypothetical protein
MKAQQHTDNRRIVLLAIGPVNNADRMRYTVNV